VGGLPIYILAMVNIDHFEQVRCKAVHDAKRAYAERSERFKLAFQLLAKKGIVRQLSNGVLEIFLARRVDGV